ncbi:uncharacterized protein EAF02_004900 [Botrytis sinoallii]|uniref:uncharacterized protein n=1 Tax=Botrytis sinoallii TaxID=1463999 RepID=UPI0019020B84|nr:uncharacterized protein EAF02_004900 [Botrytis sinoallii]KAF7884564.1 hypothetical protein EAF02_004900 [Botrytis sinoallii]
MLPVMPPIPSVSEHSKMLSPLSSPGASQSPAAGSTTADFESIDSSSQSAATNGSDSNQTLTTTDSVSESSIAAASSGIPDTSQSMVTRNDEPNETNELKEDMDLDKPDQVGASHSANNAISNTKSKKRESGNDESHQAGTSHSAKRPKKNAGLFNDGLDENNIIPDTGDLSGMRMTRAKKLSVGEKIETTNETVKKRHTAQYPTEAQKPNADAKVKPKPYNSHDLKDKPLFEAENKDIWRLKVTKDMVPLFQAENKNVWRLKVTKRKVPVGQAQHMELEGTSDPLGVFLEKSRTTLPDGATAEDSVAVRYMSQYIKDNHTPIPEDERTRKNTKDTYKFRTYFPTSALIEHNPFYNVEYIETVLETKSKENFELKAKIQKAIRIQKMKNAEVAEAARVAKEAMGLPVASTKEYKRIGLECEMISDNELPLE